MNRSNRLTALAAVASALQASAVLAATPGVLSVGATVLPRAVLTSASTPITLTISAADVARGYLDVLTPTRVVIASNDPRGFALDAWPKLAVFSAVGVRGVGADVILGREGGTLVEYHARGSAIPLALSWRFVLDPHTAPGSYPWPLQLAVRPLGGTQ